MNSSVAPHPLVVQLLEECPLLCAHIDPDYLDLPTVAFGCVANALKGRLLPECDDGKVWQFLNCVCETGNESDLTIIGTGAIEMFNDDTEAQKLARAKLKGTALHMLEEFRIGWGQPDYDR